MFFIIAGKENKNEETFKISAEQAFIEFSDMVWKLALSRTLSPTRSDDILQEVFMRFLRKKPQFNSREHCKAWLLRVTANCSNNLMKSAWYKRYSPLEDNLFYETSVPDDSIFAQLKNLPEKYRTVIHLHYYEGYSVAETADICGAKEATVKTWLSRGRTQLADLLKGENDNV